jgi:hypothetical protein
MKKSENKIFLPYINFETQGINGYQVGYPFLPVQGSSKWICARSLYKNQHAVDMEVFIFDEKKICKTLFVKDCIKTSIQQEINYYGMIFKEGNTKIIFQTNDGERIYDVIKEIFEKY